MSEDRHEGISVVTMEIEKYDNGIAMGIAGGEGEPSNVVCYDHDIKNTIGKEVWAEVESLMKRTAVNHVIVQMEFIIN